MLMTKKLAYEILKLPDGASKEEIKRVYTTTALKIHPDQQSSTPETTHRFKEISMAYKRLQQSPNEDRVELSNLMEQFSSIFRFRVKTDNGYMYFMYNPLTGQSDYEEEFFDDSSCQRPGSYNNKLGYGNKWDDQAKIVEINHKEFKEMQAKANKNAEELINEEDKAKQKAKKKREKRLRQREKKKQAKDIYESDNNVNEADPGKLFNQRQKILKNQVMLDSESSQTGKKSTNAKKLIEDNIKIFGAKSLQAVHSETNQDGAQVDHADAQAQKCGNNKQKSKKKITNSTTKTPQPKYNESGNAGDSDEPGWDEQSAFFSKAIKNSKTKVKSPHKTTVHQNNETSSSHSVVSSELVKTPDIVTVSRQLAVQGNQLAGRGEYVEAVKLFTKAIGLLNSDCRYYGNRSFCYDRLDQYEWALEDADTAINLSSVWAKGYFRKGRALAGLKRYVEAESAFEEVLKLDKHCYDAEQELHNVRMKHLMDMGFSKELCEVALRKQETIQLALDELLSGVLAQTELKDVYVSDEEDTKLLEKELKNKQSSPGKDDTFSEIDYNSLWVGNLTPRVTEEALETYFSQFGPINSVTAMYVRRCAFVNFSTTEAAKIALLAGDTVDISDVSLVIRYPDRAFNQSAARTAYKNKRECFYWRNRGCHFGSACRYLHVEANKGIDLQTVQRTPYQSIVNM